MFDRQNVRHMSDKRLKISEAILIYKYSFLKMVFMRRGFQYFSILSVKHYKDRLQFAIICMSIHHKTLIPAVRMYGSIHGFYSHELISFQANLFFNPSLLRSGITRNRELDFAKTLQSVLYKT